MRKVFVIKNGNVEEILVKESSFRKLLNNDCEDYYKGYFSRKEAKIKSKII